MSDPLSDPRPQEPEVLPYLSDSAPADSNRSEDEKLAGRGHVVAHGRVAHDVHLSVDLIPAGTSSPHRICTSNLRHMCVS